MSGQQMQTPASHTDVVSRNLRNSSFKDGDPVSPWLLERLSPFDALNHLQRQFIARGHTISKRPPGSRLIERGSRENTTLYLLEGSIEVEDEKGEKSTIVAGTRRAVSPVSLLQPHGYTVTAATEVAVIMISQETVHAVTEFTAPDHRSAEPSFGISSS